jgi:hypothetical protein
MVAMGMEDKEPAALLVESLSKSLVQEVRRRPHPLLYVNLSLLVCVIFSAGIFYARFNELEQQVNRMRSTEALAVKVDGLQGQMDGLRADVTRLTERLDRVLDRGTSASRRQDDH